MQLNITGQHVVITDALRKFVTTKFLKLERFFDRINQVYIVLKVEEVQKIAEMTVHLNGGELHATAEADDMYAAIDLLIDKLTRQLNKHKEKLKQY
ncbi:MAG: ribosome hibernation promoting factor [Sodalis sp. (in: enterobacteria)]|uniref:ribosome hibernation promoting factor n=1 Tax=Sodalis sp. (in: enterobacteria) TaxID=1898979 RepID=UPI003F3C40D2